MNEKRRATPRASQNAVLAMALVVTMGIGTAYADQVAKSESDHRKIASIANGVHDADRRFDLSAHGNRFRLALIAIRKAARKPEWGWTSCDGSTDSYVASAD